MENAHIKGMSKQPTGRNRFLFFATEAVIILALVVFGWFLIGYYVDFQFLGTGYQDWIYHAFRVKSLSEFGVASWDHIWGNGVNHWRAYQYWQHLLVLGVVKFTGLTITNAMLWLSALFFVGLRVVMYMIMRRVGMDRLTSFFFTLMSYAFAQQWGALMDFSIYLAFAAVPFFFWLWVATTRNPQLIYILTAVSGILWSLHPVVGFSSSGLLFFHVLASNIKTNPKKMLFIGIVFLLSSASFSVPYLFSGYSFSNPFFSTPRFLKETIIPEYFGLSLYHFVFLSLSWLLLVWKAKETPKWAKILLVYCSAYLVFIYVGQLGYYPGFINKFQFSRAVPIIAILLSFCFAGFMHVASFRVRSRLLPTIFTILVAVVMASSIETASVRSGYPSQSISEPVSLYFANRDLPKGSVFVRDVSRSSYVAKQGIRYVSSYNQHLLPHPHPVRFDALMKTDISYTGVTSRQIKMINDYATVLGIEYMFLPNLSPLVNGLTVKQESFEPIFEKVDEVNTGNDVFTVLRNREAIAYAFALPQEKAGELLRFNDIPKPTLDATSYVAWDEEVSRIAELVRSKRLTPVSMEFLRSDGFRIDASQASSITKPGFLVTQSYDRSWFAPNVTIQDTSLRFMYLSGDNIGNEIRMKNSWPWWHWPIQSLGFVSLAIVCLTTWFFHRKTTPKNTPR